MDKPAGGAAALNSSAVNGNGDAPSATTWSLSSNGSWSQPPPPGDAYVVTPTPAPISALSTEDQLELSRSITETHNFIQKLEAIAKSTTGESGLEPLILSNKRKMSDLQNKRDALLTDSQKEQRWTGFIRDTEATLQAIEIKVGGYDKQIAELQRLRQEQVAVALTKKAALEQTRLDLAAVRAKQAAAAATGAGTAPPASATNLASVHSQIMALLTPEQKELKAILDQNALLFHSPPPAVAAPSWPVAPEQQAPPPFVAVGIDEDVMDDDDLDTDNEEQEAQQLGSFIAEAEKAGDAGKVASLKNAKDAVHARLTRVRKKQKGKSDGAAVGQQGASVPGGATQSGGGLACS